VCVRGVVFAKARHGIGRIERVLAGYDDVAVGRDREIERAEFRVYYQPRRQSGSARSEHDNAIVTLAIRADAGGEEHLPSQVNANPRGNSTVSSGTTCSPIAFSATENRPAIAAAGVPPASRLRLRRRSAAGERGLSPAISMDPATQSQKSLKNLQCLTFAYVNENASF
jgi:hypothetical protein